jgi:hypothetical protein
MKKPISQRMNAMIATHSSNFTTPVIPSTKRIRITSSTKRNTPTKALLGLGDQTRSVNSRSAGNYAYPR